MSKISPSSLVEMKIDSISYTLSEVACQMQKLAWKKIHIENQSPEGLILFCFVKNSVWSALATHLHEQVTPPGTADTNKNTLVYGCTNHSFYEVLKEFIPEETVAIVQEFKASTGWVKYLVFDDKGIDMREILPLDYSKLQ